MKHIEKIFLHSINDLEEISQIANTYKILKSSGIIRQLLLDNNSLLDQVNREYKERILFKVRKKPDFFNERIDKTERPLNKWFDITFIFPSKESKDVEFLKKDDFLKYNVLTFGEHEFTVLEVIKICANKYGGVHFDDTKDEREQLLDRLNSSFSLQNFDCVVYSMHGIMKVCNDALYPLANRIKSKYNNL